MCKDCNVGLLIAADGNSARCWKCRKVYRKNALDTSDPQMTAVVEEWRREMERERRRQRSWRGRLASFVDSDLVTALFVGVVGSSLLWLVLRYGTTF